jgi:uncharacterized membrane protein
MRRALALAWPASDLAGVAASAARRLIYIALIVLAPLLPQFGNSYFTYPVVSHFWTSLAFCGLFLLPLVDLQRLRRMLHLDLLALLMFAVGLRYWYTSSSLSLLCVYAPLAYLCLRMVLIARVGRSAASELPVVPARFWLPTSWLLAGIVILVAVHINWTLGAQVGTDVGPASVQGAVRLVHGQPVYGADHAITAKLGYDPHYDTYGPLVYESYIPFASIAGVHTAARLATLFFDLLTAVLLFALGRQLRGPSVGVVLAYCWLAFPFTLYAGGLASNDSLVAAALVGTLLAAGSPVRRGAMVALAAWTKLSPLALVPVVISHATPARTRRAALFTCAAAFVLTGLLVLAPVFIHSSASTFVTRTFGFQLSRSPAFSIWERLNAGSLVAAAWVKPASQVAHGLLIALTAGFALMLMRAPRRQDVVGLASACAAILTAMQICLGYYSFTYILWFAPLVLVALIAGEQQASQSSPAIAATDLRGSMRDERQETTVSALGRLVSTS